MKGLVQLLVITIFASATLCAQTSNVKNDQTVVFFPSMAVREPDGKNWKLEIRGCVYEFEKRTVELVVLRKALGLQRVKMDAAEIATLKDRARLFMVDNKSGRKVIVKIGGKEYAMDKTKANGHFSGSVELAGGEISRLRKGNQIEFTAAAKDGRSFNGAVQLVDDQGLTVISDIDDTIKITEVLRRDEMLRHTFLEAFKPVPGMAEAYESWAKSPGARFHYVSASPWQLYLPLSDFVHSNGFPEGIFELKTFRLKDKSFVSLFESPEPYKLEVIEPLMKQFPARQFVFVGDSGERDPEAYGALARKLPGRVVHIFIRNVTSEGPDAARYQKAFRGLPSNLWQVFDNPSELPKLL